jgi:mycoredoxin
MSEKIKLYGHAACPGVPSARIVLQQSKANYEYIDIYTDLNARMRVREINQGYESVPTFEFADGSTLTEPSERELRRKLEQLGYTVPIIARIVANWPIIVIGIGVLFALLRVFNAF